MKPIHALPPLAALIGSACFLIAQRQEASGLQSEVATLRRTLDLARSNPPPGPSKHYGKSPARPNRNPGDAGGEEASLSLTDLARLTKASRTPAMPDMRAMVKLQTRLMKMSAQEFKDLLDQTQNSELSVEEKEGVQSMLLQALAQKDPKAAVMAGAVIAEKAGLTEGRSRWTMDGAFQQWVRKDPAEAAAWYDAQIAAGRFENKALTDVNEARVLFENGIFASLLKSNPAAARARLENLTPAERKAALTNNHNLPVTAADQVAFTGMVDSLIDEKDRLGILANYAGTISRNGKLEDVGDYLNRINATPEQRAATTVDAAMAKVGYNEKITVENSADWRKWVQDTAPENAPSVIGKVLGKAGQFGDRKFEESAALIASVSPPGKQDETTAAFLEESAWRAQGDTAVNLAKSIQNPELQAATLKKLEDRGIKISPAGPAPVTTAPRD